MSEVKAFKDYFGIIQLNCKIILMIEKKERSEH